MAAIEADRLVFGGPCDRVRAHLVDRGLGPALFRDAQLRLCLRWATADGAVFEDEDLHELLAELVTARELAFLEHYGSAEGPAELMRLLRAEGRVPAFNSLILRGGGDRAIFRNP